MREGHSCTDMFNLSKHWSRWGWCESWRGKSVGRESGRAIDLFYKYKSCWRGGGQTWHLLLSIDQVLSLYSTCQVRKPIYINILVVFTGLRQVQTSCRCWGRSVTSVSAWLPPGCPLVAPIRPDGPARRHLLCSVLAQHSELHQAASCTALASIDPRGALSCQDWGARYFSSVRLRV